jgi:hypothetical protein
MEIIAVLSFFTSNSAIPLIFSKKLFPRETTSEKANKIPQHFPMKIYKYRVKSIENKRKPT